MKSLVFILALATFQSAPPQAPPPGWKAAMSQGLDLTVAGKDLEVVALYEKWVARHPDFAEAHLMLGAAHESVARSARANRVPDARATSAKYYESAIGHMRRGLELAGPTAPFDWMRGFIDIHSLIAADRPAEYERLIREAVVRYPAEPHAHSYLLSLLAQQGKPIDAAAAAARAALPKTAAARSDLAASIAASVTDYGPLMPAASMQALLTEALSLIGEALTMKPGDARALRTRARLEQIRKRP
jgi:hypothetical protein